MSEEEIYNYISENQNNIETIKKIKERVALSETEQIRLKIETKHWYGYSEPFLSKEKHTIETTKKLMQEILDGVMNRAKKEVDLSIDLLIKKRGVNK